MSATIVRRKRTSTNSTLKKNILPQQRPRNNVHELPSQSFWKANVCIFYVFLCISVRKYLFQRRRKLLSGGGGGGGGVWGGVNDSLISLRRLAVRVL